ncbi:MAG: lycopene cyclase family protein [Bacteroidota bacterium]
MNYDYIIAGSGLSGLSLLYCLLQEEPLSRKRILVLDKAKKNQNDRTYCFWERGEGLFESIIHKQWSTLEFCSPDAQVEFELKQYHYKMVRAADFYDHVLSHAGQFENVTFKQEPIEAIKSLPDKATVKTSDSEYSADYVFNSTRLFDPDMTVDNTLLQHFKGWFIKTDTARFNDDKATFMDFRMAQEHGTTFMYFLPTRQDEALVEYTLFSREVLADEAYDLELKRYIRDRLGISDYDITHTEFGVIPMTTQSFKKHIGKRIINIGTAGGYTKASTGYTFQFVQKNTKELIGYLRSDKTPAVGPRYIQRVFDWYDRTLLDVLLQERLSGQQVFSQLFNRNPPEKILEFLANESSFWGRFNIRNSVPMMPFMISGIRSLIG